MRKAKGIIFDMDGTLYQFKNDKGTAFTETQFMQRLHENAIAFFKSHFNLDRDDAIERYRDIRRRFDGEVSLGLEREHSIPRVDYFAATWGDMKPAEFVADDLRLLSSLRQIGVRRAVLSAAPMIWMDKVLEHLAVRELFGPAVFSGDPDIRKPDPEAFMQVARFWGIQPNEIVSVGDIEKNDILPARQLGMVTVRIGNDPDTQADFTAPDIHGAIELLKKEYII